MEVIGLIISPLIGAVLNGLVFRSARPVLSHILGVVPMFVSFLLAVKLFLSVDQPKLIEGFSWINAGALHVPVNFLLDRLSSFMSLIVTGIGTLIHIYAGGYMHEEQHTSRFFCYLNLFVFMMLLLVFGENMVVMFVGWEGVGLCSYLLIGYWYLERENASAGMKAFVVNRIGDIGFLLGIFMTYTYFGTLSFTKLREIFLSGAIAPEAIASISLITLALFTGACGKSAQFPLFVWLPDAMAGPTPVSALIHAATMVTAGIYMICRLNFVFVMCPEVMSLITTVGALTAFMAACIAVTQNDIKKVLAYSTVSQLGYMAMACGAAAFSAGFFHVFTHACFKALLFMCAGSVIVAMHHEQDMRKMGGLAKYLPVTHILSLAGVLAIIGTPGFSGFFSKDEILWRVYASYGFPLWIVGTLTAALTAFYMVRMYALTFLGKLRSGHPHEVPIVMWGPLVPLAFLSVGAGFLGVPEFISHTFHFEFSNWFQNYFDSTFEMPALASEFWPHHEHDAVMEWTLMGVSVALAMLSAVAALVIYRGGPSTFSRRFSERLSGVYSLSLNKFYLDEFNHAFIVQPLRDVATFLFEIFDRVLVDGVVNGFARGTYMLSGLLSYLASGSLNRHALFGAIGLSMMYFVAVMFSL